MKLAINGIDVSLDPVCQWFLNHQRLSVVLDKSNNSLLMLKCHILHKVRENIIDYSDKHRYGIYLHKIIQSDRAGTLHNHMWNFFHMILRSGYFEHTEYGSFRRGLGYFAFHSTKYFHRVELDKDFFPIQGYASSFMLNDKPSWSLFIRGPKKAEWGFKVKTIFVHWKEFFYGKDSK